MRLARGMPVTRACVTRSLRRRAVVAGTTCLLLAGTSACGGPAEGAAAPADTVHRAVERVTAQESATVIAELDAPVSEVRALLAGLGRDTGAQRAERLARTEVALALAADRPLNELERYSPQTRLAAAVSFGDRDVVSYKSVKDRVYLRLQPEELLRNGSLTGEQRRRVTEVLRLTSGLPDSLQAAKRLLGGDWVSLDPEAFSDYGWALEEFTGLSLDAGDVRNTSGVLDGEELRTALEGLRDVLTRHAGYRVAGDGDGDVERFRVGLPARRTARALAPLLRELGSGLDARDVPARRVPGEVTVRRGVLDGLTVDLGELTGGSARVPLRLRFSPGDVYATRPPPGAVALRPQDLLAAALYGATQRRS